MTYQGEIFIAVIADLAAGHIAFNVEAPVGESVDACCVESAGSVADALPARKANNRAANTAAKHARVPPAKAKGAAAGIAPAVAPSAASAECVVDEESRSTQRPAGASLTTTRLR